MGSNSSSPSGSSSGRSSGRSSGGGSSSNDRRSAAVIAVEATAARNAARTFSQRSRMPTIYEEPAIRRDSGYGSS